MKKSQTAGRSILACLFAYLLIQIYYLSAYIIPSAPGESWEKLAFLFLVQSYFFAACIFFVFVCAFWQYSRQKSTSPFTSLLLVSGEGKIKHEFLLQGRKSFLITGKKNGKEVYLEDVQTPEPGRQIYGICNLSEGNWYLEAVPSKRAMGLKRENDNMIYKIKEEIPYRLYKTDVIYADTYKIVVK